MMRDDVGQDRLAAAGQHLVVAIQMLHRRYLFIEDACKGTRCPKGQQSHKLSLTDIPQPLQDPRLALELLCAPFYLSVGILDLVR